VFGCALRHALGWNGSVRVHRHVSAPAKSGRSPLAAFNGEFVSGCKDDRASELRWFAHRPPDALSKSGPAVADKEK
ncbi:MAG: hypothetical protein AAGG69_07630, partial [Pseudomonadota bacterium]